MANGCFGPLRDDEQNHPDIGTPHIRLALTEAAGATLESDVLALIIDVLERPPATSLQMIANGSTPDGKTIMLLQHVALIGLGNLRLDGPLERAAES